jgi:hypothetical protein
MVGLSESNLNMTFHFSSQNYRGKGLGKHEDGIQSHVKITKREEKIGVS